MLSALRRTAIIVLLTSACYATSFAQTLYDNCSSPGTITPQLTCTNLLSTLFNATIGGPANACGTSYDAWFSFTVPANSNSISISMAGVGGGTNITAANTSFQVYSGTGCTLTPVGSCTAAGTTLTTSSLTPSTTYILRVFTNTNPNANSNKWEFNVCITYTASITNDECSGATVLTMGSTNSSGSVWNATPSAGIPLGCASGNPDDDVWYRFTATSSTTSIALSSIGTGFAAAGPAMQLFSGTCGALNSLACAGTTTMIATGLSAGSTYYLRVYSDSTGTAGYTSANTGFSITASVPTAPSTTTVVAGRMNEVFQQSTLSGASILNDPWEVTYGPDGYLWITEAKGYKLHRIDPNTGARITVLDISQNATFLPTEDRGFNVQFASNFSPWPQGGFAGMALHPQFMHPTTPKNFVYVSYVHSFVGGTAPSGRFFTNRIVRFSFNTASGRLEDPVSLVDTLPGSNDHNSQRMIIAPVNGTYFLFYASGDMGAGQYDNTSRAIKSQINASYEGKILRFNLETDGEGGFDGWIPNDNPFNGATQSAVWSTGMRNNQGFAFANINGTDYIYGSSHGPYSDDEINIIERSANYGHPLVIGYAADGNYNNSKAGVSTGTLPLIVSESANATAIGSSYRDPIFSAYAASQATVNSIYNNPVNNGSWPSEGWSGMDIYTNTIIPGWKNSLVIGSLKWGRVLRLKLNGTGNAIVPTNGQDTVSYFGSTNRFRDVAFAPNGRDLFVIMDKSATTSGPTASNPVVPACGGCLQKYTFLGYNHNSGTNRSYIPSSIEVTTGTNNTCLPASTITINSTNNNIWVPITGPDGNIVAEIKANGNNLGEVTSSLYLHSGAVRENSSKNLYLNRSITITPQVQPSSAVSIRLYLTPAELNALKVAVNSVGVASGVNSIADLSVMKNSDNCQGTMVAATSNITPVFAEAFGSNFVVQANISSFSTFYFGKPGTVILPVELVNFKGNWKGKDAQLTWETRDEQNSSRFEVERSLDGNSFTTIGSVAAGGNTTGLTTYGYLDKNAALINVTTIYYRLKLVDNDGRYSYSRVISLTRKVNNAITVYPNPVTDVLNLRMGMVSGAGFTVQVADLSGRVVLTRSNLHLMDGKLEINVTGLKPQVYMIRLTNSRNELLGTSKFEKL